MNTSYPSFGTYNQQLQQIQSQLNNLQNYHPAALSYPQVVIPTSQPESEQIKSVTGIDGAKAYLQNLPPNSSAILLDNNENIFYSVKKDANGIAFPIGIGEFTLRTEDEIIETEKSDYVTKKELEAFLAEIKAFIKEEEK